MTVNGKDSFVGVNAWNDESGLLSFSSSLSLFFAISKTFSFATFYEADPTFDWARNMAKPVQRAALTSFSVLFCCWKFIQSRKSNETRRSTLSEYDKKEGIETRQLVKLSEKMIFRLSFTNAKNEKLLAPTLMQNHSHKNRYLPHYFLCKDTTIVQFKVESLAKRTKLDERVDRPTEQINQQENTFSLVRKWINKFCLYAFQI